MALVLWSGGCDSTLVLYRLLKEHQDEDKGYVHAISVNHDQVPANKESQIARKKILAKFKKMRLWVLHTEVNIKSKGYREVYPCGGLTQPTIWLTIINYLKEKEDLYFGYIKGDDIWHHKYAFEEACKNLFSLGCRSGNVIMPLEYTSKEEVIKELKQLNLLDLCWYCERPEKGKACGDCLSCKTHRKGMWAYETWNKPIKLKNKLVKRKIRTRIEKCKNS